MFASMALYTAIAMIVLYIIIWIVIIVMSYYVNIQTTEGFNDAYQASRINTEVVSWYDNNVSLRLSWKYNKSDMYLVIDPDGIMQSPISFTKHNTFRNFTVTNRMRQKIESRTKEIAAMHKLQHGPIVNDI